MNTLKLLFALGAVVGMTSAGHLRGLQDSQDPVNDPNVGLDPSTLSGPMQDGDADLSGLGDGDDSGDAGGEFVAASNATCFWVLRVCVSFNKLRVGSRSRN